ncbi:MAG: type II secretion system F family protein, partial [Bacilli bacterium]
MANFTYTARDNKGKKNTGTIRAQTKQQALESLRKRKLRVLDLKEREASIWDKEIYIGRAVPLQQFSLFLRQFATL